MGELKCVESVEEDVWEGGAIRVITHSNSLVAEYLLAANLHRGALVGSAV